MTEQRDMFDQRFDGDDYKDKRDRGRLTGQLLRIYTLISGGQWWTLQEISDATGDPHSSVSAQLRNLRKVRFGKHTVERDHLGGGLYRYRLV
jgi:hypothetical protein